MKRHYKVSLITTIILVISSFIPVLQITIMTANGGFLNLFTKSDNNIGLYTINTIGSALFLFGYFASSSNFAKIFMSIAFIFFFFPLIAYLTENIISQEPYFLSFCVIGILSGLMLILMDTLNLKLGKGKISGNVSD